MGAGCVVRSRVGAVAAVLCFKKRRADDQEVKIHVKQHLEQVEEEQRVQEEQQRVQRQQQLELLQREQQQRQVKDEVPEVLVLVGGCPAVVYVSPKGKCVHVKPNCTGLNAAAEVRALKTRAMQPCKACASLLSRLQ